MSNDLNQCQFIGRLGKDVETRYMANGDAVASFSLAVGSQWKDKSGEKKESTEWVNCSAFGKLAEICTEYLSKGSQVFVSGRMKTDKYTDKQGIEKYTTKIVVDRMQMLGSKTSNNNQQEEKKFEGGASNGGAASYPPKKGAKNEFDDMDDDIPFISTVLYDSLTVSKAYMRARRGR